MAKSKDKSFSDTWKSARPWPVLSGGKKSYPTSDIGYLPQKLKNLKIENKRASKEDLLATPKKKKRKGGPVGHRVGEQVTPNPMGGNLGVSQTNSPIPSPQVPKQAASKEKPPSQQDKMNQKIDASNKLAAAKAEDLKVAQRQSIGKPQGQPQAPGKPQPQPQRPPVLSRKGGTIKTQGYRGGGKVYSNACRAANNPVA